MTTTDVQKQPGRKLIPASDDLDERELAAVKAVKAYETCERKVRAFELEHAPVFVEFRKLATDLENRRKVADAAVRAVDASFGPWERFSEKKSYDVPMLYSLVGDEKFRELGGTVDEMTAYNFDREKLEIVIAAKRIPASIVKQILTVTPNYRSPKPLKTGAGA